MDPDLQHLQLYGVYQLTQRDGDLDFHRYLPLALQCHPGLPAACLHAVLNSQNPKPLKAHSRHVSQHCGS